MTGPEAVFLVPEGIDDPARVSGGNVYDRHVRDGLVARGWRVSTVQVRDAADAGSALGGLPRGATVLVDGLVALRVTDEVVAAAGRLRIVVLAHMVAGAFPDATAATVSAERQGACRGSPGDRDEPVDRGGARATRPRGTRARDRRGARCRDGRGRAGRQSGEEHARGPDASSAWGSSRRTRARTPCSPPCRCSRSGTGPARSPARQAPTGTSRPRSRAMRAGSPAGCGWPGCSAAPQLAAEYRRGALLVAPSRVESAGMAIAEARGHGMPAVATAVGGIPDTVAGGGAILVPPDDPAPSPPPSTAG